MELQSFFSKIKLTDFSKEFPDPDSCYAFLAEAKWRAGFVCKKCGNDNYCQGKTPHSRRCTRCKHDESATAHTPFHGCRLPLDTAFRMAYEVCCRPEISSYKLAEAHQIRQMTCWKLKKKIMECIG